MADVYEQNLAQKSTLTTSDFIRVVGSDNVSYKQNVSNVNSTIPLTLVSGLTTEALIGQAYITAHTETPNGTLYRRLIYHAFAHSILGGGVFYLEGYRADASYGWQRITSYGNPTRIFTRSINNGTWTTWAKEPTRAEIDALNSKTRSEISTTYASYVIVYKRGNVGFIRISNPKNLPANTTTDIGTIPDGYLPAWEMVTFMNERGASTGIGLTLTTAGLIRIYNYSTNTGTLNINEVFSYPIA